MRVRGSGHLQILAEQTTTMSDFRENRSVPWVMMDP